MAFGRLGKNNRSQHALPVVEQQSPAPANANDAQELCAEAAGSGAPSQPANPSALHSASPSGFSSRESLETRSSQQQQQQQQAHPLASAEDVDPPHPPPHHVNPSSSSLSTADQPQPALPQNKDADPVSFDPRQHVSPHHDLSPPISHQHQQLPQGHHYPLSPVQTHPQFSPSDDPQQVGLAISSPVQQDPSAVHSHGRHQHHSSLQHSHSQRQQRQQQHHPALPHPRSDPLPPEPKRSTRKLIKNILTKSSRDNQSQSGYDNTSGLARRPSKRTSHAPDYRYSLPQPSQVAVDQNPNEWQHHSPHHVHNQSSPLPGVGEIDEEYHARHPDAPILGQGYHEPPPPTIRRVATDLDVYSSSPYREHGPPQRQLQLQTQQQQQQQQQGIPQFQLQSVSPNQPHGNIETHQAPQQQQQQRTYPKPPPQGQYRNILPQLHTGYQQNFETSSQVSRESPVLESTPSSQLHSAQISPAPATVASNALDNPLPPLPAEARQDAVEQEQTMAPPSGGSSSRRSQDADKALRTQEGQMAPPTGYRHGQSVPQSAMSQQNPALRGSSGQDRPAYDGPGDQGRNSPQPEREDPEKAFKELLTKYKNVKRLYFENKAQIEQMSSQIEHLQNAVANQRITASRTALDDSEYSTRFKRLNGAINNMAFNIRKDWKLIPLWLNNSITQDALKTGKQEMTAVGRAVITRWIVEEVFSGCFHPSLEPSLSRKLKEIENGIRRGLYTFTSQEEHDALTNKVISWRMATLEGLQPELNAPEADEIRAEFTQNATKKLVGQLMQYLNPDPPPAGIEGSASMIMELAVGIAANMPLESRDVVIRYPLPGDPVDPAIMEVEKGGLPSLETGEEKGEESGEEKNGKERKKGNEPSKVRLAGFVALEVRGRQVLMKAPVWTMP